MGSCPSRARQVGSKPFVAGDKPNLGDLCVYACIRAIEGMDAHKVSYDDGKGSVVGGRTVRGKNDDLW